MNEPPELYLTIEPGASAAERLALVLGRHPIACVRMADTMPHGEVDRHFGALVDVTHAAGVPILITNRTELARQVGADGVHLASADLHTPDEVLARVSGARDAIGGEAIVGVGAGPTRHEAMRLGEADVSYLMFEPSLTRDAFSEVDLFGEDLNRPLWLDRLSWWAEVFEVPAVAGGITTSAQAMAAARTGAEFIELRPPAAVSAGDLVDWISDVRSSLTQQGKEHAQ